MDQESNWQSLKNQ